MSTLLKYMNTLSRFARHLHQRGSPLVLRHVCKRQIEPKATKNHMSLLQHRSYGNRFGWRDDQYAIYQSGLNASYELPNMKEAQPRYDDLYYDKPSSTRKIQVKDEGFDPRHDEIHFRKHERRAKEAEQRYEAEMRARRSKASKKIYVSMYGEPLQEIESRRRLPQDSAEHQRRQERIIKENKLKWQKRLEQKREVMPSYVAPGRAGEEEDYSRRRRSTRERQPKSNESRRDSNLSNTNTSLDDNEDPNRPTNAWLKQKKNEESQYWHSWTTCPDERQLLKQKAEREQLTRFERPQHELVTPPRPYDGSRRSFHQHQRAPVKPLYRPQYQTPKRRKPNGMQKQFKLGSKTSLMMLKDEEKPMPRPHLNWTEKQHEKKLEMDGEKKQLNRRSSPRSVQPPRFRMTVKAKQTKRMRTPTGSFSERMSLSPVMSSQRDVFGFMRPTICDTWENFTKNQRKKSIY